MHNSSSETLVLRIVVQENFGWSWSLFYIILGWLVKYKRLKLSKYLFVLFLESLNFVLVFTQINSEAIY